MRINDAKTWDPITSELNALESALQQEQTLCPAKRENLQSRDSEFDEVLSAVKRWLNPATRGPRKTVATTSVCVCKKP